MWYQLHHLVGSHDLEEMILFHIGENLSDFPVDGAYLKPLRARVSLAKQIHTIQFRKGKVKKQENWFSKSAKAMDIELDEDMYPVLVGKGWDRRVVALVEKLCRWVDEKTGSDYRKQGLCYTVVPLNKGPAIIERLSSAMGNNYGGTPSKLATLWDQ